MIDISKSALWNGVLPGLGLAMLLVGCQERPVVRILNASFDPTRELYESINEPFARHWKDSTGQEVQVLQSHGGSGKQARAVIDGLEADVVSLALSYDIDQIARKGRLLDSDWARLAPGKSIPFASTIVFLVRDGNPKGIHGWQDLARPGVEVVTPNPQTSGGARWNWLAAWGAARLEGLDSAKAAERCKRIWKNVRVQDAGARAATTTFALREMGDVLITWENEAYLASEEMPERKFLIVHPEISIRAEPPVAVVDSVCARRGTCAVARAWLANLWSRQAQEAAAANHFRPTDTAVASRTADRFPDIRLFTVDSMFGGWKQAQKEHFGDSGLFRRLVSEGGP
ncbi:MAG TPA: sulfate ABC transporter substrate-binding protein [Fibrobacteria bacterium]|nr:sulfate ABC transporter substrate-binding protein [Fibrobacteria bacterium]